jgi:hypothetical protein
MLHRLHCCQETEFYTNVAVKEDLETSPGLSNTDSPSPAAGCSWAEISEWSRAWTQPQGFLRCACVGARDSSPAHAVISLNLSDPKAPIPMEESSSRPRLTT